MITSDFIETTNNLIAHLKQYDIHLLNGEILIAKQVPPKTTKGGLVLDAGFTRREGYFRGLGRVIMAPSSTFKVTGGELPVEPLIKQGDYVLFNHAARYKPFPDMINFLLDKEIEDAEVKDQYESEYSDVGMLFIVPQAEIKLVRDGQSVYRQVNNV